MTENNPVIPNLRCKSNFRADDYERCKRKLKGLSKFASDEPHEHLNTVHQHCKSSSDSQSRFTTLEECTTKTEVDLAVKMTQQLKELSRAIHTSDLPGSECSHLINMVRNIIQLKQDKDEAVVQSKQSMLRARTRYVQKLLNSHTDSTASLRDELLGLRTRIQQQEEATERMVRESCHEKVNICAAKWKQRLEHVVAQYNTALKQQRSELLRRFDKQVIERQALEHQRLQQLKVHHEKVLSSKCIELQTLYKEVESQLNNEKVRCRTLEHQVEKLVEEGTGRQKSASEKEENLIQKLQDQTIIIAKLEAEIIRYRNSIEGLELRHEEQLELVNDKVKHVLKQKNDVITQLTTELTRQRDQHEEVVTETSIPDISNGN